NRSGWPRGWPRRWHDGQVGKRGEGEAERECEHPDCFLDRSRHGASHRKRDAVCDHSEPTFLRQRRALSAMPFLAEKVGGQTLVLERLRDRVPRDLPARDL